MNWQTVIKAISGLKKARGISRASNKALQDALSLKHLNRTYTARKNVENMLRTLRSNQQWRDSLFTNPPKTITDARKFPIDFMDELKYRYGSAYKNYQDLQKAREYLKHMNANQRMVDPAAVVDRYKRLATDAYTKARNKIIGGVAGTALTGGLGYGTYKVYNRD